MNEEELARANLQRASRRKVTSDPERRSPVNDEPAVEAAPCTHFWSSDHEPGHLLYWVQRCQACGAVNWDNLDEQLRAYYRKLRHPLFALRIIGAICLFRGHLWQHRTQIDFCDRCYKTRKPADLEAFLNHSSTQWPGAGNAECPACPPGMPPQRAHFIVTEHDHVLCSYDVPHHPPCSYISQGVLPEGTAS